MKVIKSESSERRTTVELTDRELTLIYAVLLETDFKTDRNHVDGSQLWAQFADLTSSLGLEAERRALYHDAV